MVPEMRSQLIKKHKSDRRPEVLKIGPLHYAPENELGVVFLFSAYAKKHRIRVDEIHPQFPDCIAYQKIGGKEKPIRIEFEFKSRNFKSHLTPEQYPKKRCDWIVCWEHNWPEVPERLKVIELRKEYGLGFNVWIQPVKGEYGEVLSKIKKSGGRWTVSSLAHQNDLILFYHATPDKYIKDIFRLDGSVNYEKADWKEGMDHMSAIRRVCQLKAPIFFEDLKRDKIMKTAPFVRGMMMGRPKATEYWPYLYELILRRNPSVKNALAKYDPQNL